MSDRALIKKLRRAHAIEVGAYQAYEGHWRVQPKDSDVRAKIKWIQIDELIHKETVARMLMELGSEPNRFLDTTMWLIGRAISLACYVSPSKATNLGAAVMEILGARIYDDLYEHTLFVYGIEKGWHNVFLEMRDAEWAHEQFFSSLVWPQGRE